MNIKLFNILLARQCCQIDQDKMNQFLDSAEVEINFNKFRHNRNDEFLLCSSFWDDKD